MTNREEEKLEAFEKISTHSDLKQYLHKKAKRLQHTLNKETRYLCHYTNIEAAVKIIQHKTWYIGSPIKMNDGLELSHNDESKWRKIFFASFMLEPKESIAMWSMYAQPWTKGVMIRIPVEKFKNLIKNEPCIHPADIKSKEADMSKTISDAAISFHAVAYTNADSIGIGEKEILQCGGEHNDCLSGVLDADILAGYVKDLAWSYENEYRLRVDVDSDMMYPAVSIGLSDDFIDSVEIVSGPRFKGDLQTAIQSQINKCFEENRIRRSLFDQKLMWVYCDSCIRAK